MGDSDDKLIMLEVEEEIATVCVSAVRMQISGWLLLCPCNPHIVNILWNNNNMAYLAERL